MARIAGFYLPKDKRVEVGLTYVLGIGLKSSKDILKNTGVDPNKRIKDLTHEEVAVIQKTVSQDYIVGGDLKREVTLNIKRLQEIGSYRGLRHKRSLPARGQRTKTNARTKKGPRKSGSVIPKKKIASKK